MIDQRTFGSAALIYLGYAFVLFVFLTPAAWILSLSFKPVSEMLAFPPRLIPSHPDLVAYATVLVRSPMLGYVGNSLLFATTTVIGCLLIGVPAAYALSRLRFGSPAVKQAVMMSILGVQLISPLVTVLPLYRYFAAFGLVNVRPAAALVYIAVHAPFATWMLKGFFDTIPSALDDAARVDGCSRFQLLVRVLLPVMTPSLAATSILVAISTWGQFLIPYILLDKPALLPISVGILQFQSTTDAVSTNQLAAAAVLSTLPALLVFIILQRFILAAMTSGAVKG